VKVIRAALTDQLVDQAEARGNPYKLSDGGGMYLLVHPKGGKYWQTAFRFAGKQKNAVTGRISRRDAQ